MIKILRKLHFYIALISAIFLTVLCLSGALLIFADSLDKTLFPAQWAAQPEGTRGNIDSMIQIVEQETHATVTMIDVGLKDDDVWRFKLSSGKYANLDPYRMSVTKHYDYHEHIYGFTMQLHRWLLLQNKEGNKPLQDWVSIVSLSLMLNMLVGFYLWYKPKYPLKRLRVRLTANTKILFSQLHNVAGVFCVVPLLLIAFSGIAFNWQVPVKTILETLMVDDIESRPVVDYTLDKGAPRLPVSQLVSKGINTLEAGVLYRIYLPTENQPLRLRIKMPNETHAYSWVWIEPNSGEVLASYNGEKANFVTQVWRFKYKFHIGQFISPHMEWLWLLLCLLPLCLLFTGLWVKIKRRRPI